MKQFKISIIATVITAIIIVGCSIAFSAAMAEDYGEFYPRLTVVVDSKHVDNEWIVYCVDHEGNIWAFYDDEGEWERGDIANLLMWNIISESIEEHEIINVYWSGYIEDIDSFLSVEWR